MNEEKNKYALLNFKREYRGENDKEGTQEFQQITFYKLNPDGSFENGTTLEEMLRVVSERLSDLDSRFHCEENVNVLKHIEEARMSLEARTKDREDRGVEGQHKL